MTTTQSTGPSGPRELPGDRWGRVQQELAVLMAPTGHPLPPIEADEQVPWVRVDHRRRVLRIHPRTTNLNNVELHCTLAAALVELAHGPNPVTTRAYRALLGLTSATAVLLAITAAARMTPHALTTVACIVAVLCLLTGAVTHRAYRRRVDALLRGAYRPPEPEPSPKPSQIPTKTRKNSHDPIA